MKYIISGLSFFLISIIVNGTLAYLRRPKQTEAGKVYLPKAFLILGVTGCLLFLIPAIIIAFGDASIYGALPLFLLSLLGAALIIAFTNCRISYDEEGFTSKNFWGITRKFTYDQVTAIKESRNDSYIYIDKRRIAIDGLSIGGKDFIKFVKKNYRTLHDGKSLPKASKSKWDIFNGNVQDVTGFWFATILVSLICIAGLLSSIYITYFVSFTESNTTAESVSFITCNVKQEEIVLSSSNNKIYKVENIDNQSITNGILSLCDGEKKVTVYSREYAPEGEENFYSIKAIKYNDDSLLSFDETNKWRSQNHAKLIIIFGVLSLLWALFITGSIIIGRNPKKFSRWIVRLFFKDGAIKY